MLFQFQGLRVHRQMHHHCWRQRFRSATVLFQYQTYEFTDKHTITVGVNLFRCVEVVFQQETYELTNGNLIIVGVKRAATPPVQLRCTCAVRNTFARFFRASLW